MKKRYKIIIGIVIVLIGVRLYLPYAIKNYLNKMLQDLPGYTGSVADVDLHLYRGAYRIDDLQIFKITNQDRVPFFSTQAIDLSVEWKSLFDGAIVSEIYLETPELNFITSKDSTQAQYGDDVDWTQPVKKLMPIRINRFGVRSGEIHFRNFESEPPIDLFVQNLTMDAYNLTNSESKDKALPSDIKVTGTTIGSGSMQVDGAVNILKEMPDMDLNFKLEGTDLPSLNDFLKVYANVDAEEGDFNLYSEVALNDGEIKGYVKPILHNINLVKWSEDKDKPLQMIWEAIAGTVLEIFENQKKDQFASRVPLDGNVSEVDAGVFPAIWSILRNAFVEAFKKQTDGTIEFGSQESKNKENG